MTSPSADVVKFLDGARAGEAVALDGAVKCLPALSASVRPANGVRFLDGGRASAPPQVHNEGGASGGSPRCRERLQDVAPTTLGVFPSRTRSPRGVGPDDGAVDKASVADSLDSRIGCRTDAQPPSPVAALAPPAARDISGASKPASEPPGASAVAGASPPAALSEREKAVAREVGVWGT